MPQYNIKIQTEKLLDGSTEGVTDVIKGEGGRYIFPRLKEC